MTETPRHSVSVAAAIFDDSGENVLLIKRRDNGHWEPPGGILERHESIGNGLRREVREETGAEIEIGPLTGIYKNMTRAIVDLVFRASIASPPETSSEEASVVAWTPVSAVPGIMPAAYAARITDAASQQTPPVRAHDGEQII